VPLFLLEKGEGTIYETDSKSANLVFVRGKMNYQKYAQAQYEVFGEIAILCVLGRETRDSISIGGKKNGYQNHQSMSRRAQRHCPQKTDEQLESKSFHTSFTFFSFYLEFYNDCILCCSCVSPLSLRPSCTAFACIVPTFGGSGNCFGLAKRQQIYDSCWSWIAAWKFWASL
jgi:hypothetical protein